MLFPNLFTFWHLPKPGYPPKTQPLLQLSPPPSPSLTPPEPLAAAEAQVFSSHPTGPTLLHLFPTSQFPHSNPTLSAFHFPPNFPSLQSTAHLVFSVHFSKNLTSSSLSTLTMAPSSSSQVTSISNHLHCTLPFFSTSSHPLTSAFLPLPPLTKLEMSWTLSSPVHVPPPTSLSLPSLYPTISS